MNAMKVSLGERSYPIYVGRGILRRLPALLAKHGFAQRAVIVTDPFVRARFASPVLRALKAAGWEAALTTLPRGEKAKSLAAVNGLYNFLLRFGAERRTPIIAIGGGTVGDAAGFAAATYYRGVPLVHVPTTLLAQVDSAIGGKTGVNHPLGKNAIGAFHQPAFVLSDVDALRTLPEREFLSGMAEVVKYGLLFDRSFARGLAATWGKLERRDATELIRVVSRCASFKAKVVAGDERDAGGRREFLNFGHTLGHALESATEYRHFTHGEAVAWGMSAAVELSASRGWMTAGDLDLALGLLSKLNRPAPPKGLSWSVLQALLKHDKKARNARNVFILLRDIGRPVKADDIAGSELANATRRAGLQISGGMR